MSHSQRPRHPPYGGAIARVSVSVAGARARVSLGGCESARVDLRAGRDTGERGSCTVRVCSPPAGRTVAALVAAAAATARGGRFRSSARARRCAGSWHTWEGDAEPCDCASVRRARVRVTRSQSTGNGTPRVTRGEVAPRGRVRRSRRRASSPPTPGFSGHPPGPARHGGHSHSWRGDTGGQNASYQEFAPPPRRGTATAARLLSLPGRGC